MSGFGTFGRKRKDDSSTPGTRKEATLVNLQYLDGDVAQQQSAYVPKKQTDREVLTTKTTVVREGAGKKWEDSSLLEWNPEHFRLFVGNIGNDVGDDQLHKAFGQFGSCAKARVIRDRKTGKSKGFGFVAFRSSDDYLRAFKEMNGKYIGSHPVTLRRAQNDIKPTQVTTKVPAKGAGRRKPYDKSRKK